MKTSRFEIFDHFRTGTRKTPQDVGVGGGMGNDDMINTSLGMAQDGVVVDDGLGGGNTAASIEIEIVASNVNGENQVLQDGVIVASYSRNISDESINNID